MKKQWKLIKRISKQFVQAPSQFKRYISFQSKTLLRRMRSRGVRVLQHVSFCTCQFFARIKKQWNRIQRVLTQFIHIPRQIRRYIVSQCKWQLERMQSRGRRFVLRIRLFRRYIFRQIKKPFSLIKQGSQHCLYRIRRVPHHVVLKYKEQLHLMRLRKNRFIRHVRTLEHNNDIENQKRWQLIKRHFLAGIGLLFKFSRQVLLKCKRQFHRIYLRGRRFIRQVQTLEHNNDIENQKRWRLITRSFLSGICLVFEFSRRVLLKCKRQSHCLYLRVNRYIRHVQDLERNRVLENQKQWRRTKRSFMHCMHVLFRFAHYIWLKCKEKRLRIQFSAIKLNNGLRALRIGDRWKRQRRLIQSRILSLSNKWSGYRKRVISWINQPAAKDSQIKMPYQRIVPPGGQAFKRVSEWDLEKVFFHLYRKKEIVLTCCVIALFLPVLFLKVVRNGIHSLLTQNASHDSFGKGKSHLNSDGLLCFNDGPRTPFFQNKREKNEDSFFSLKIEKSDANKDILASLKNDADPSSREILVRLKIELDPPSGNEALLVAASDFFSSSKNPSNPSLESGGGEWAPQRLFLRDVQETGDGFGSVRNYWTLDALVAPLFKPGQILPLIDVRWHEFSDDRECNRFAANVGLMARYIPESHCAPVIGGNLYYDYRHSSIDKGWNRWGIGMEVLGKRWDFRLNGYFPIGGKLHMHKCTFDDFDGDFKMVQRKYEFMYTGFNADIGCRGIVTKSWQVYLTGGTYYLSGKCHFNAWGFRIGIRPQFKDYIALDLSVSHDHIFNTVYQGQIIFSLPLYSFGSQKNKTGPCGITQRQIYQPVERFDIIPVSRVCCWDQNF